MDRERTSFRRRCAWLRTLATVLMLSFVLVLAIDVTLSAQSHDFAQYLAFAVPYRLPVLFYLAGVWTIRMAFARLAAGEMFGRVLPLLLRRLGLALACGGFASVFLTPWFWRLFLGPAKGALAAFDPPAITVGLVGLLMVVLANLMGQAEDMRQELDEFF